MGKCIIYIVCHNDGSEKIAHEHFSKYSWARIYRIPDESQTYLMENVMYHTELMKVYDEWKDAEIVGTLSYKLPSRFIGWNDNGNIQELSNYIIKDVKPDNRIYGIKSYYSVLLENTPIVYNVIRDTCKTLGITITQRGNYDVLKRKFNLVNYMDNKMIIFHNYWMTTPSTMTKYIEFFNKQWLPALELHPDIWKNSNYQYDNFTSSQSNKDLMLKLSNGRVDYYSCHATASERIPTLWCLHNNVIYHSLYP